MPEGLVLQSFSMEGMNDGRRGVAGGGARLLPRPEGLGSPVAAFAVGWLLYGVWGWRTADAQPLRFLRVGDAAADTLHVGHDVGRIEPFGDGALVLGEGHTLTLLRLDGERPVPTGTLSLATPSPHGTRLHGLFGGNAPPDARLIAIARRAYAASSASDRRGTASVLFLRADGQRLSVVGEIAAVRAPVKCHAACFSWYENTRGVCLDGRIFALMGYEIVEAVLEGDRLREVRRVRFGAP
jgi:hypothetical protein